MLHVNIDYKGKSESFDLGAVPRVGDVVIHPVWKGTRVIEVVWDVDIKTKQGTITVRLVDEAEYESVRKR